MADRTLVPVEDRTPTAGVKPAVDRARIEPAAFAAIAVQVGLVLGAAVLFRIELERGFATVAALIFGGFLVHAWLPLRWRLPLFVLLSMTAIGLLMKADAVWLVSLGISLLGICHLPIAWFARMGLVLVAAAALAAVQTGALPAPFGAEVIPVLAAMFMFRLILYLYDLKHDRTPADPWQRVAYFFLLPNVCFPVFPVVDYKTFLTTYYDSPAAEIYQKGAYWMLRGLSHLLLYRMVYYLLPLADTNLHGILGVYVFMAMTYALYLRISGLFHMIVGSLCLFGFNLPATNRHYFLASSITDFWRRINIYWKDFMMTVAFYPVLMRARWLSQKGRLVAATVVVIVVTWFLHAYQWFWLQGELPLNATDIVFWGTVGVALTINTLREAGAGRRRRLSRPGWAWKGALGITLRTLGLFSAIAVLWTLWSDASFSEWWYRLLRVRESSARDWMLFAALLGGLILAGVVAQWLAAHDWGLGRLERVAWRYAPRVVPAAALSLILIVQPVVFGRLPGPAARAVRKAQSTNLNWIDQERQERGYYETLSRSTALGGQPLWARDLVVDEGVGINDVPGATVPTTDLRGFALAPQVEVIYKGATFRTNQWGFRDRSYEKAKPAGTYRVALIGASYVMGSGVENQETFDNVLEDRLNRDLAGQGYDRYEILNFAVGGYGGLQSLFVAEHVVPEFQPDAVMFFVHPGELWRIMDRLRYMFELGARVDDEYGYVNQVMDESGAHLGLPPQEFTRRLKPYREDFLRWVYDREAAVCRGYGATPVHVLLPLTPRNFDSSELEKISELAGGAGSVVVHLRGVYEGHSSESIRLTPLDHHPNALGHRLIADRLYEELLSRADTLALLGPPDRLSTGTDP